LQALVESRSKRPEKSGRGPDKCARHILQAAFRRNYPAGFEPNAA
jgi:hypothetical protein